jgi:hypothetical protein
MAPATARVTAGIGGYSLRANHETISGPSETFFAAGEKMRKPAPVTDVTSI